MHLLILESLVFLECRTVMDKNYSIEIDERGVVWLTINRPEKRNAFDDELIAGLCDEIIALDDNKQVRVIVLGGEGKTFSSGADLNWMKSMADYDEAENLKDSKKLAELMYLLYHVRMPTIAKINGDAFGGAIGLIACCDISISVIEAQFSFSEVKLGIIPAVISPYVIDAIGSRQAKRVFLTGEKFSAFDAYRMGLIHDCVSDGDLDSAVEKNIKRLLAGGPVAQTEIKKLVHSFSGIDASVTEETAKIIARLRISNEGQEGIGAFLEKRIPEWNSSDL